MKTLAGPGSVFRVLMFALFFVLSGSFGAGRLIAQTAPVAQADTATTLEDNSVLIALIANDSDADSDLDSASLQSVDGPFHGTLPSIDTTSGTALYAPFANFQGVDSFSYQVCDTTGLCDTAWVLVIIQAVNDAPQILNDTFSLLQGTSLALTVLLNDSDTLDAPLGGINPASLAFADFPSHGSASLTLAGEINYTPSPLYFGLDSLAYSVADSAFPAPGGLRDTAWVHIEILQAVPSALPDSANTSEDGNVLVAVLANDSDPQNDLDSTSLSIVVSPLHGSALPEATSPFRLSYTPDANFSGQDSLVYQVCDTTPLCASAWVYFTVLPVSDPPLLVDDSLTTNQTETSRVDVLANDLDPLDPTGYLDTATLSIAIPPLNGAAFVDGADLVYAPLPAFFGADSMAYRVCDAGEPGPVFCDTAWVTITVLPGSPIAAPDTAAGLEDELLVVSPLGNDSDPQNNLLIASLVVLTAPLQGSLLVDTVLGQLSYLPNAHFFGPDSLRYQICDSTALCAEAWVSLNILPVNDAPIALRDTAAVGAGLSVVVPVLANDTDPLDPDGGLDASTITLVTSPIFGTIVPDLFAGTLTYSADLGVTGLDSAAYRVCDNGVPAPVRCDTAWLVVRIFEAAPTALRDTASTLEDTPVFTDVLVNDTDPQNDVDASTLVLLIAPSAGLAATGPGPGQISYTPDLDFHGTDSLLYKVCDATALCDSAWLVLSILPVNDQPNILNDTVATLEDTPLLVAVLVNDNDDRDPSSGVDAASVVITVAPGFGTALPDGLGGVLYTPDAEYNGPDQFTYTVCDTGEPLPSLCGSATVFVTIDPVNDPPIALPDSALTLEDTPVITLVLLNDTDVEDGPLLPATLSLFAAPAQGSVGINTLTGQVTYSPDPDYYGLDEYVYRVCDSNGACDTAVVSMRISPVNDPPLVQDDAAATLEDVPVVIPVLANDNDARDPAGGINAGSVVVTTAPLNGSTSVSGTGLVTYTPDADFNGTDSFRYRVCDLGFPLPPICAQAWVLVTVGTLNDPPVLVNDAASVAEDGSVVLAVLANDFDAEDGLPLPSSVLVQTPPAFGATSVNLLTGQITYTPDPDYHGPDALVYQACDSDGACGTASVALTVTPVNDPPVALDDLRTGTEDVVLVFNPLINDGDPLDPGGGLAPASVINLSGPFNGTVVFSALTGQATYTPNAHYNGVDSIRYQVCDTGEPLPALCTTASAFILLTAVNDAPLALDDTDSTPENTAVSTNVLANDADPFDPTGALNPATVTIVTPPANGSAVPNLLTGAITYTPDLSFVGTDTYTYQVCDNGGPAPVLCDQALVTIIVSNEAPTANNDLASVFEGGSIAIAVLDNDTDPQPNLDTASVTVVSGPSNGATMVSAITGVVTYTPNTNFYGSDLFEYRVCDLDGFCDQALVTITVNPVNDAPVVQSDVAVTAEDTPITTVVLANDSDPLDAPSGIDPTSVTILTPPSNGSVVVNPASGTVTYTPNPDFNGVDFYVYQACDLGVPLPALCDPASVLVTVTPVNDVPIALDDAVTTTEDVPVAIAVLANDSDVEDGTLVPSSVVVLTSPANGSALVNPTTGVITYTPALHYNGPDAFSYQACDSDGACDAATVNLTVTPVNDPPLVAADAATTAEDTPVVISVLANDSDANDPGGTLNLATVTVTAGPMNGTVVVNPGTGQITYTPSPDYQGPDAFTYSVCDNGIPLPALCGSAVVSIAVTPNNDAPVVVDDAVSTPEDVAIAIAVLANDSDVEDGTLVPSSVVVLSPPANGSAAVNPATGVITYTPALHYNGPDAFTYQACDSDGACDAATVTITVTPVNDAPVVVADAASTAEDTPVVISVLANDSDANDPGGTLNLATVAVAAGPSNGTVLVNPGTGQITYTPSPDYYGPDAFTYTVCDNGIPLPALCGSAVVTLAVNPVNDAPIALNDAVSTPEGAAVVANVLANDNDDADPDGGLDAGSVSVITPPLNGTAAVNALTGEITYTPNPGFGGVDSLVYQVCDLGFPLPALCSQALLLITVSDQSPTAVDDAATLLEDGSVVVPVLANDIDPQDNLDPTSVTLVLLPLLGAAAVNPVNGNITYTSFSNLNGTDFLDYRVCDLTGYCDVARLNLTITPVNDAPQVLNDNSVTPEETSVATPVLANDSDPLDAPLGGIDPGSITFVTGPLNGSVVGDPFSGIITYTPDPDFFGFDSYTYRVCDLGFPLPALCGNALVVINVTPVDDPYIAVDDFFSTPTGTALNLAVLSNDIDPDGDVDPTSVEVVAGPLNGSATALTDGTVDYAPATGYLGLDSLRYGACDANGNCDSAWVVLNMDAFPPVAINDSLDVLPEQPTVLDVLANDQPGDSPLDPASVTILLNPAFGTVSVDTLTGEVSYTPDPGFCGLDAFGYQVCDERGLCSSALVILNVRCIDLEAVADAAQTGAETPIVVDVLGNDSPNADPACLLVVSAPANGSAAVLPDGQILYTPAAGFSGTDCFTYSVCDTTESLIATAEVCVEVLPEVVLQVPVAFSPNGDGYNDLLVIPGVLQYPDCDLTIFNRWESRVFQAKGYDNSWDGRWEGNAEPLPDGTYFFILRLNPDDPEGAVRSGAINIIR